MAPFVEPPTRADRGRVRHLGIGRGRYRPAQRYAVEAAHDGREAHLAGGDAELGHVDDPQLVGPVGPEAALAPSSRGRLGGASETSPS